MKEEKRISLKAKIMGLSLGMMIIMAIITILMVQVLNGKQKSIAQGNMEVSAQGVAAAISSSFKQRYGDIQAFAANQVLLYSDKVMITDALNTYVKLYQVYDIIALYDIEGDLVASNDVTFEGKPLDAKKLEKENVTSTTWFKNAKLLQYSEEKEKGLSGAYVEDFQLDELSSLVYGDKKYGNSFSKAIFNLEGKVVGVLTARANFKWAEKEFQNFYNTVKKNGMETTEFTLLNNRGEVIVDFDPFIKNGNTEVIHDANVILKFKLADTGYPAAKDLLQGKSGNAFLTHARKGVDQFVGFVSLKENPDFYSNLGWGLLMRAEEYDILGEVYASVRPFYWFSGVFFFAAAFFAFFWSHRTSSQLVAVSGRLKDAAEKTSATSESLGTCSTELSACNNEQAAAVQETVSAMEEMNSMINQTNEYIQEGLQSAKTVTTKTEEGAEIMKRMVDAMASIQEANGQLTNMANIIREISTKTNVINDIVFKTQLLSFNASIEAARAGQHGRGFAVVAEEVGNLAQMSGAAAKEIKSLLDDSQKQVLSIVEITKSRSEDGQDVSKQAQTTFDAISGEIKKVTSLIENISDAAREQQNGVQQTSVAMGKLDEATTRSASMSNEISSSAQELGNQSTRMNQIMQATALLVQGTLNETKKDSKSNASDDLVDNILNDMSGNENSGSKGTKPTSQNWAPKTKQKLASIMEKVVRKVETKNHRKAILETETKNEESETNEKAS